MPVILLIALGFIMSAFFSGAETALVSINWIRLDHWLEKGRGSAKVLERFVADPHRMLGTTLVGTNIAVVMTSSLVSWKLVGVFPNWSGGLVGLVSILIVTPVLLVFGEVIPKVIGRRHSDAITLKVVHPLRMFYYLLSPVILVTTGMAGALLRPFGIRAQEWRGRLTKDQLRLLLTSEGERAGAVDEQETRLISGIFEFGLTTIGEVMVPRTDIVGVSPDSTVGEAVELVRAHGYSRLPVLSDDRDHIEGMVHSRDLLGMPRDQDQHLRLRCLALDAVAKFDAADFGETHVHQSHVGLGLPDNTQRLFAVRGLSDDLELVVALQNSRDAPAHDLVVVNNHYADHSSPASSCGSGNWALSISPPSSPFVRLSLPPVRSTIVRRVKMPA